MHVPAESDYHIIVQLLKVCKGSFNNVIMMIHARVYYTHSTCSMKESNCNGSKRDRINFGTIALFHTACIIQVYGSYDNFYYL